MVFADPSTSFAKRATLFVHHILMYSAMLDALAWRALRAGQHALRVEQTACSGLTPGDTMSSWPHFSRFITFSPAGGSCVRLARSRISATISSLRFRLIRFGTMKNITFETDFRDAAGANLIWL
jgi:hypothetical protein